MHLSAIKYYQAVCSLECRFTIRQIGVACAAAGLVGQESNLFRFTLKHSLVLVTIISGITVLQADVVPGMIP
jgi:L-lactate permease